MQKEIKERPIRVQRKRTRGWRMPHIETLELLPGRKFYENLRGYDVACWCKVGEPCHADVLLEFANK